MRIALVSLNQKWEDKPANLKRCRDILERTAAQGCNLVVFPEMTLTGYSLNSDVTAEIITQSDTMNAFAEMADKFFLDIVFGCCLKQTNNSRVRNMLCHSVPMKGSRSVYAKLHPFTYSGEEDFIEPGNDIGYVDLAEMTLGASICYDLRFPVLYSIIAPKCTGALCIANWPASRISHWKSLLVARAIENQMFMIGVNRVGSDPNGLTYVKSSMLVAPDGQIIDPFYSGAEFDSYNIDPSLTKKYRTEFPTLRDADFERYDKIRELLKL